MNDEIKEHLENSTTWSRGFHMLLFGFIYWIAKFVIFGVVVINFGFAVVTGAPNVSLTAFGQQLSLYVYQILRFLTFNSEYKPFPFDNWDSEPEV
ncbi:MAG: DUF4389 domain-containing protein [Gammaproteobacteria bacterium]|nr:DUF4389 domain-containing protein [Gammaproteobacteria bacterium]